ncbi:gsp-2 [Symbiodinium pilosum]|uniref:Gsp-2 protein n=1 Tax=Symbiodinium pilosum TaxID=2952 RepID=A0A812VR48_SYMPI|nr:gsp-2 [Symbiodinium pilosum]
MASSCQEWMQTSAHPRALQHRRRNVREVQRLAAVGDTSYTRRVAKKRVRQEAANQRLARRLRLAAAFAEALLGKAMAPRSLKRTTGCEARKVRKSEALVALFDDKQRCGLSCFSARQGLQLPQSSV